MIERTVSGRSTAHDADPDAALADKFAHLSAERISPQMMTMYLLIESRSLERVESFARRASSDRFRSSITEDQRLLATQMLALIDENRTGCARIVAMLESDVDTDEPAATVEAGIAFSRRLFDWSVQQSPEASVALYSLGNPAILEQATTEIINQLEAWDLIGMQRRVLDIGCGTGRLELALASKVRHITGIDVSTRMVETARTRCVGLSNVTIEPTEGRHLGQFASTMFDLVLSVDAFPYLVQSGLDLVASHFEEVARVLRPGGAFLILNFSYRGNLAIDRAEVARLAAASGMKVWVTGLRPFRLWDGIAYLLRRPVAADQSRSTVPLV